MPPTPATIPANLHNVLSSIRSSVFLTTHNPTGARLGNKYLRKPLKGEHIANYYPAPIPRPSVLTTQAQAALRQAEQSYLKQGGDIREVNKWKTEGQIAPGYVEMPHIPQAVLHEGLFWDAREDKRMRYVAKRKRIGKGKPKKGEGKKAQMQGKKK